MPEETEINWGFNCLTAGIHHGRPEAIWNIPLGYAVTVYSAAHLEDLVLARIYNDAKQVVEHNVTFSDVWAGLVREKAKERYADVLAAKRRDLESYYQSSSFHGDMERTVDLVERDKLNPSYEPLHLHDSINLLCRILGTGASIDASRELGIQ